ncbi:MAG: hypothetical protein SFX74_02965 [Fimbriimonadaceae bacterium]|nr:hypothetical protein [Fimbriimonadaceae bacterium]
MTESLRQLLDGVIDYAGMFPPAALSRESAEREYHAIKASPESWLVRRFAVPATALAELDPSVYPVTVIGRAGGAWDDDRVADAEDLNRYVSATGMTVSAYECPLPRDDRSFRTTFAQMDGFSAAAEVFLEVHSATALEEFFDALAEDDRYAAKLRTGGASAPSPEFLATFLMHAIDLEVPVKLTAGLHHPITHFRSTQLEYGFVSVLGAVALALAEERGRPALTTALTETDASQWSFGENTFWCGSLGGSLEDIEDARALLGTFGSCSVAEPVADLTALGWWDQGFGHD